MLFVVGVLAAIVVIALSIALHEIGHLLPAKKFGLRVPQYMVGFGPTIWSTRRGETEYGVKAIPLGGYVRMIGMFPPPPDAPEGTVSTGSTGRLALLVEDARRQSWEEMQPGDENRVFYKLPTLKKLVIMLGGPFMNLLIAFGLFTALLVGIGIPTATTSIDRIIPCVPPSMTGAAPAPKTEADLCPAGAPASPAASSGLKAGDVVVAVNGKETSSWTQITDVIRAEPTGPVTITVERDGARQDVTLTPATVQRTEVVDGQPTGKTVPGGFVGVSPEIAYESQPIGMVPGVMWDLTTRSVTALVTLPMKVWELAVTLVTGGERDPEGPVSVVGVGRLSGEIAASEDILISKAATFLSLMAGLNLFLFLFNLVPILPLDGGHVAGALYEAVRRKWAALRGRPDPGYVDVAKAMPLAYGVSAVLLLVSSVVILADLIKPITLPG